MAARGLDLPRLRCAESVGDMSILLWNTTHSLACPRSHVVNFDLPHSAREYVHRAGRTGRLSSLTAGHAGIVVSLVGSPEEEAALDVLLEALGVEGHKVRGSFLRAAGSCGAYYKSQRHGGDLGCTARSTVGSPVACASPAAGYDQDGIRRCPAAHC